MFNIKGNKKGNFFTSAMVITLFFLWPYIINFISRKCSFSENNQLVLSFITNFLLIFILVFVYYGSLRKHLKEFIVNWKKNILLGIKWTLIGLAIMFVFNFLIYLFLPDVLSPSDNVLGNIFQKIPLLFVLNTLFYYPIVEEIVFKRTFKDFLNNKWFFVLITGFLNAFFNIAFSGNDLIVFIYVLPNMALYSAWSMCYYESNNIFVSILMRMLYNVIPTILFLLRL